MNSRPDLLALTPDDLAVLTNRGTVKRAQREVDAGEVSVAWEADDDGRIQATWSDGAVCVFPAQQTVREARCSCPSAELCRHLIRTVLAWQRRPAAAAGPGEEAPPAASETAKPWNPGEIPDRHWEEHAAKGLAAKARAAWDRGVLVECVTGIKPWVRFYDLGLTVRFPVPGDIRYAHCDCGQPGPCLHALLAVLAFRRMPAGEHAALIANGRSETMSDLPLLREAERIVEELVQDGIAAIPAAVAARWKRCATALQEGGLSWLAVLVQDILLELERYQLRDALFAPDHLAALAGELLIRCDALRHGKGIPRGLAGGWKSVEKTDVGYSRWIGLGSLVTLHRKSVSLGAYLQEAESGSLGVVTREVADPADGKTEPADFAFLARGGMLKGAGIRLLGSGQVLTESCRRTPDNRLSFGRARAQVSTQAFEWEKLRAPLLVEDFAELRARLALLPPRSLRPRRDGEDFHVLPVASNSAAVFDPAKQVITAALRDTAGSTVQLQLPWTARGEAGCRMVLDSLTENRVLFLSGQVALSPAGLLINPAAIVFRGEPRCMIQPWADETLLPSGNPAGDSSNCPIPPTGTNPLPAPWQTCGGLLMDLLVTGCHHQSLSSLTAWQQLSEDAAGCGCHVAALISAEMTLSLRRLREAGGEDAGAAIMRALVAWRTAVDLA